MLKSFFKVLALTVGISAVSWYMYQNHIWTPEWPGHKPANWQAQWLVLSEAPSPRNSWWALRRTFEIKTLPSKVMTRIAADSKYWLWVNGSLVIREGALKRGPWPNATYFDEFDIAPYLNDGTNTIAVLVWHFGKHGYSHRNSGQAGFLFEASLEDQKIMTDENWKYLRHPGFLEGADDLELRRLPESNIVFDASKDIPNWEKSEFNDQSWQTAKK